MKTKEEIIIETVRYYTVDGNPRSINPITDKCLYHGPNGAECGFQRCVRDDCKHKTTGYEDAIASHVLREQGFDILKKEYRIEEEEFWDGIQSIHDRYIPEGSLREYKFPGVDWDIIEEGIEGTGIAIPNK